MIRSITLSRNWWRIAALIYLLSLDTVALGAQALAAQSDKRAALADMKIGNTNILSSAMVPEPDGLPEYCRVLGYVRPTINFEIRLPTADWYGKFYIAGCGDRITNP